MRVVRQAIAYRIRDGVIEIEFDQLALPPETV